MPDSFADLSRKWRGIIEDFAKHSEHAQANATQACADELDTLIREWKKAPECSSIEVLGELEEG